MSPDRKVLLIGRNGQLARAVREEADEFGVSLQIAARPEVDLTDAEALRRAVLESGASFVLNAAAYTNVDQAEADPEGARALNALAPFHLARAAAEAGARLVHVSTDYVFDGTGEGAYSEIAETRPLGTYGLTKLEGEEAVRAASPAHAVVRTSWVYSPWQRNFVRTMLAAGQTHERLRVVDDQVGCPTSAHDLARGLLTMITRYAAPSGGAPGGTYHLAGTGWVSWAGFAREIFEQSRRLGGPSAEVVPITTADWPTPAARPANSRLDSSRFLAEFGYSCRPWKEALRIVLQRVLRGASGSE